MILFKSEERKPLLNDTIQILASLSLTSLQQSSIGVRSPQSMAVYFCQVPGDSILHSCDWSKRCDVTLYGRGQMVTKYANADIKCYLSTFYSYTLRVDSVTFMQSTMLTLYKIRKFTLNFV